MNFPLVVNQLAKLVLVLTLVLAAVSAWSGTTFALGESPERDAALALLAAAVVGGLIGGLAWYRTRNAGGHLGRREALLLVALSWILGGVLCGVPYLAWAKITSAQSGGHPFANPVDCCFESLSGLTTTGATILSDIAALPRGILLWRALTHWIGGLGIVVLFVAVLPSLGVGGKRLFVIEAPGPAPEGLQPHIRDTARVLWYIYLGLTLAEIGALKYVGLDWYESVCHTFATLATGGFSTRNASLGEFDSNSLEVVVTFFMVLAGTNFGLFYLLIRGRFRDVWRDTELRVYLGLIAAGSLLVCGSIYSQTIVMTNGTEHEGTAAMALREGVFTTVSIQTTTGFCTSDFNHWPFVAKAVLIALMFVGGSAGSTSGGIKVIRIWMAIKIMYSEIERVFRPRVVRPVRIGGTTIDTEMKLATVSYCLGILLLFIVGAWGIMVLESGSSECSFTTASTASVATLCTIGPGLERVGAIENYGWFTNGSKFLMCVLMLLGRLEVFAIIVLLTPRFWRSD